MGHLDHQGRHRRGRALQEEDGRAAPQEDPWEIGAEEAPGEDEQRAGEPGAQADRGRESGDDGSDRVRLLSVPRSLRSVDVQAAGRAVRGMLLLAVVVLVVLGGRWWWVAQGAGAVPVSTVAAGPEEEGPAPVTGLDGTAATAGASGPQAPTQVGAATSGTSPQGGQVPAAGLRVVVHVVGEVRKPGVVELPAGSRVADAVEAVGGLTDAADHTSLNLARPLVDGEQVWVGAPGEEPPPAVGAHPASGGVTPGGGAQGIGTGAGPSVAPTLLDLNTATQADLEELPGIGPVTAGRILAWREQHGRFTVVEELMEVSGIGERTFAQLEPLVTVGG